MNAFFIFFLINYTFSHLKKRKLKSATSKIKVIF